MLAFVTSVITARFLGPAGRGAYFFVITTATIVAQFANCGLQSSNTYLAAKDENLLGGLVTNSIWISIIGGVGISIGVIFLLAFFKHFASIRLTKLLFIIILAPANLFFLFGANLLVAINKIKSYNFIQLGNSFFLIILMLLAAIFLPKVSSFLLASVISWSAVCAIILFIFIKRATIKFRFNKNIFQAGWRYSLKAYLTTLLGYLILKGNIYILQAYCGNKSVGYYSIASQISDAMIMIPATIALLLFPQLVRNHKTRWQETKKNIPLMAIGMLFACIFAAIVVKPFILLFYGHAYFNSITVLLWMLPGIFFLGVTNIASQYLAAIGFPRITLYIWGITLTIVILTSFWLIPRYAENGSAMALSIGYFSLFCMILCAFKAYKNKKDAITYHALTISPLHNAFLGQLSQKYNHPIKHDSLKELRELSLWKMIVELRKMSPQILILPFVDNESLSLLPMVFCVAALTKSKQIEVVYPNLQIKNFSRYYAIACFFKLITACAKSYFYLLISAIQLKKLLKLPREIYQPNNNKTLYLNANLWFGLKAGGSVGHIAGVVNALNKKHPKSFYASITEPLLVNNNIKTIKLNLPKNFSLPFESNYYNFNQLIIKQIVKKFKQTPLRFIYQRLSIANYAGVVISRKLNIPLIIEYNGSEVWIANNWGKPLRYGKRAIQAENACLQHATLIVTISDVLKNELILRGIESKRIVCYPNCIDPDIFNPDNFSAKNIQTIRQKYQISNNALVFSFVGTFGKWHGTEVLAQAVKILVDKDADWLTKNNIIFMLIGDGVTMDKVQQIVGAKKYTPFVKFTGLIPQADTPGYLAASDVLLSPHVANQDGSKFFGSPTKLFEYMAMGKGIIASNLEQIGEVLKDSLHISALPVEETLSHQSTKLAVLCDPGSPEDIEKAIKFMAENPKWRKQLGLNARAEALKKYTWDKHVETILNQLDLISLET